MPALHEGKYPRELKWAVSQIRLESHQILLMPDSSEGEAEGSILDILQSKEGSVRLPGGPPTSQLSEKSGCPRTGSALVFLLCSVTAWE